MNIELATGAADPSLSFLNCEKYEDNSGFGATISVCSSGFSARVFCGIDAWALEQFIIMLDECNSTLTGKAKLEPQFDHWFIELEVCTNGHVVVSGKLYQSTQELSFEFQTDQTCLSALLYDLKSLSSS